MARAGRKPAADTSPGDGGSRIEDVARRAGVSVVTVSRVFNNYPHVSDRMRQRVFAAARHVGYTPRVVTRPRLIGVLAHRPASWTDHPGRAALAAQLLRSATEQGLLVEVLTADKTDLATQHHVDGLIEWGLPAGLRETLFNLPNVPRVSINQVLPDRRWHAVSTDYFQEAQQCVSHLRDHGHRRIALVLDGDGTWAEERRRAGYEEIMHGHTGNDFRSLTLLTASHPVNDIAAELLKSRCTACAVLAEARGHELLQHLVMTRGVRIPADLSVVTIDSPPATACWIPPLTSVREPVAAVADRAVLVASGGIRDTDERIVATFQAELIERASVAVPKS